MPDTARPSALRTWGLLIGVFFLGVISGVLGTVALDFAGQKTRLVFPVARLLDTDLIYLKSGKMMSGRILSRNDREIVLEVHDGSLKLEPGEISRIDENHYTRYFKKVW
jgi:hypothetical protein